MPKNKDSFILLQQLILESQNDLNKNLSIDIEDLKGLISKASKEIEDLNTWNKSLHIDLKGSISSLEKAESLISKQDASLTELNKVLKNINWERTKEAEAFQQKIEGLLSTIKENEEEIKNSKQNFKSLKNKLEAGEIERNEQTEKLNNDLQSANAEIGELDTQLNTEIQKNKLDLESFSELVKDETYLKNRVDPFINDRLKQVKDNFQEEYGDKLAVTVTRVMTENQDSFIQVIYPMMGKLVKTFIRSEMEKMMESINSRVDSTISAKAIKRRFSSIFSGVSVSELAAKEVLKSSIESVYVIHKESGLLIGSYSKEKKIDEDMLAGMLTAIKQFSEEAFNSGKEDLSSIDYGDSKVYIQNIYKYYVAVVINGIFDAKTKEKLESHLLEFSESHLSLAMNQIDGELYENISKKLKLSIYEFNQDG